MFPREICSRVVNNKTRYNLVYTHLLGFHVSSDVSNASLHQWMSNAFMNATFTDWRRLIHVKCSFLCKWTHTPKSSFLSLANIISKFWKSTSHMKAFWISVLLSAQIIRTCAFFDYNHIYHLTTKDTHTKSLYINIHFQNLLTTSDKILPEIYSNIFSFWLYNNMVWLYVIVIQYLYQIWNFLWIINEGSVKIDSATSVWMLCWWCVYLYCMYTVIHT